MELNATHLFERPSRGFHNSEPWWTSYFSMLVLWGEVNRSPVALPYYRPDASGNLAKISIASFAGATYKKLVAEGRLHGEPFGLDEWPMEYRDLKPDLTYIRSREAREVIFVEAKTIGANVLGNIGLYENLAGFLRSRGWSVEFYYLLSRGHEGSQDWVRLASASAKVITWEDVFRAAAPTPFGTIFGESLAKYVL